MIFTTQKYQLTEPTEDKLVVTLSNDYLWEEIIIYILSYVIFTVIIWNQLSLQNFGLIEGALVFVLVQGLYRIIQKVQLIREGEVFIFSKLTNSVRLNEQVVGRLDKLTAIRIVKHQGDHESPNEYQLCVYFEGFEPVKFRKTANLDHQRVIGQAIAHLSNVPFSYQQKEKQRIVKEREPQSRIDETLVRRFEKQYAQKTVAELKKIIQENSPYANYAKLAARNLLKARLAET